MKVFTALYDKVLIWSRHKYAARYLVVMSFCESIFFPIPVDVMLAPMTLAKREKAWFYAAITSLASVTGGVLGYLLGYFAFESIVEPMIQAAGYTERYLEVIEWFKKYGFWVVFLAGFSPIPYKIFTVSAGALHMAILPFILASTIGRSARFFLVAGLIYWGGDTMERKLREYIDILGWIVVSLVIIAYLIYIYIN
ncbi:MAG: membrane protein YqaA with SNARE-associated domain [Enterobacterales bacterium]|jgi:membrane protein YqaA with SNARE-associated domain